jgi:hypothetical protein
VNQLRWKRLDATGVDLDGVRLEMACRARSWPHGDEPVRVAFDEVRSYLDDSKSMPQA